ncbi:cobalt-precorrin 5A hydrolase [Clostridium sporogenes]|uniref:cobalt-precorrin 5A hydrolase n=1 Tax=Clostridium sporogenes TaxID=1509 RepID=UPI002238E01D|nr:cobalt-precorrin 5A hydrolase [Clostridium sporogenes]MCW6088578.1 cobalt-precorrin 5A hydrolase [Clostridium sporogenes]MCW6088665.1 cobalt-precorrin 5A hydrolase [Clostridium sporogenes]
MNLEKESRIMKISIINVTKMGNDIAYKIKEHMDADLYSKYVAKELIGETRLEYKHPHCKESNLNLLNDKHYFKKEDFNFKKIVKKSFQDYDAIIFISSTGIAVRAIASFIQSKDKDPAVIVIDSVGRYVISLLSGHLGGANELTEKIAKTIGAEPIITTATDNLNIKAPDIIAKENNLVIEDLKKAKEIAALLVNGQKVTFIDEDGLIDFPKGYVHNIEDAKGIVFVTNKLYVDKTFFNENEQFILENESTYKKENLTSEETVISKYAQENINPINKSVQLTIKHEDLQKQSLNNKCILKLIRKNIVLGIGCRKNYDDITMKENVIKVLKEENINFKSINSIVSVEIKKDEIAIKELSKFLRCPFITYSLEEIKKVEHKFKGSEFVRKTIGVGSVCEPSIELKGGKIIKGKQKLNGMTLAIGKL